MSGRKPRADAKLRNLPPDQKTKLVDWLVDLGMSYDDCVKRIEEEFGIQTSRGAVSDFYAKECWALRFRKARGAADEIKELLNEQPGAFDEATLAAVAQKAFELSIAKDANPKDLVALVKILGGSAKLQLDREKLELEREKLEFTRSKDELRKKLEEAEQTAGTGGITPETLERIRREAGLG